LVAATVAARIFAQDQPEKAVSEPTLTAEQLAHWAFQRPIKPQPPRVQDASWIRTPVDAFVLAKLEAASLKPSPPAEPATLLRRVTFDLTGLPPTPKELDDFLNDTGPDAYARVVDRLLASQHYGERWAQHWLDVVRYAESNGYEADGERPHAWHYRDYVIRAFNDDKPYDQFITEQLAGDLLAAKREDEERGAHDDCIIATGFNRCGQVHVVGGNTDPDVNRQEVLTEMTTTVGAAIMGLTIACARCHDHKFDPISQADYYRLQAFFAATQPKDIDISTEEDRAAHKRLVEEINTQLAPLKKQVEGMEKPVRERLGEEKRAKLEPMYREALAVPEKDRTPEQKKLVEHANILIKVTWDEIVAALSPTDREQRSSWRAQIHALEAQMPPPPTHAWAIEQDDKAPATHLLMRGDPKQKGPPIEPGFPRALGMQTVGRGQSAVEEQEGDAPRPLPIADCRSRSSRLALAHWMTQPDHPLTARVMVNRIWQHHFGRGLVATPNDFGFRGDRPTHPELLDWLAIEFVEHGWSLKHMHRLMVLSSAYQQSSKSAEPDMRNAELGEGSADTTSDRPLSARHASHSIDPDNRLLWRMNRRRLDAEPLRDAVLAVAGTLNRRLGGPMVRVPLEPEVYELIFTEGEPDGLWHVTSDAGEHARRSIYLFAKRNVRLPLFEAFDQPDTLNSCSVRATSTFAPQALILMNGPFMQEQSKAFAARLLRECGADSSKQIDLAYRLALARPPRDSELKSAREFLTSQSELIRGRRPVDQPMPLPPGVSDGIDSAVAATLADFCLALLNRNEFLYVK
jgi:hypothetical protein